MRRPDLELRAPLGPTDEAARNPDMFFKAFDPALGVPLEPPFRRLSEADVDLACALAHQAYPAFRDLPLEVRANFLEAIASKIESLGDVLVERAMAETGLPMTRIEGERGRTCAQLRLFAAWVRRGDWIGAIIDPAQPDRAPAPRPDLRQRKIGLGPVAVFGASNFPLAFSVAGGDTAAALAAGCPVIVKGHPAHPGTSELVALAVSTAVRAFELPTGVFCMLLDPTHAVGERLVRDPRIKAVGFTGSRNGGLALLRIANARPTPIPVFAEMSSVNPVILLPAALGAAAESLAKDFVGSLTLNAGQFCTNPGLILGLEGPALDRFVGSAAVAISATVSQTMLTPAIHESYEEAVSNLSKHPSVTERARGQDGGFCQGRAALFETTSMAVSAHPELAAEVFGPCSIVVRCPDEPALVALLNNLEGQLTATLHFASGDVDLVKRLLPSLEGLAGRIVANGWPTGVELGPAMVHGGPFPATTDGRTTSVGATAIERFLRPVCYQGFPDDVLPEALASENPLALRRFVDGEWR